MQPIGQGVKGILTAQLSQQAQGKHAPGKSKGWKETAKGNRIWCYLRRAYEIPEAGEFRQKAGNFIALRYELAKIDIEKPEKGQGQIGVSCIDKVPVP